MIETLYVVITNKCQLDCKFCFNKFVNNFKLCNSTPIESYKAITAIKVLQPKAINFIGGEPLLFPKRLMEIMEPFKNDDLINHNRVWTISTNLYYKDLDDLRIQALNQIQKQSSDLVTIGSSYSFDRFFGKGDYFNIFKKNMLKLDEEGIRCGITVTMTKEQIENVTIDNLLEILDSVKAKCINIERCIYPLPKSKKEYYELIELYYKQDLYMKEFFEKVPENMNYQYNRFKESVYYRTPLFNNQCSKTVFCLYDHGLYPGCTSFELSDNSKRKEISESRLNDKLFDLNCRMCEYFPYCKGDCECNRSIICTFPKQTFQYMKNKIIKERNNNNDQIIK